MPINFSSWRIWPIVAATLATLFIVWDVLLVSSAHRIQSTIDREVELLNQLGGLNDDLHQLGLLHRVEQNRNGGRWEQELGQVRKRIDQLHTRFSNEPGVPELPDQLHKALYGVDSLHYEILRTSGARKETHAQEAVLQIMLQRGQMAIDRTAGRIHEEGLRAHSTELSRSWDQAQVMLVFACVMAVVFAYLMGMNQRLLQESRLRSEQLALAKQHLEKSNRELRETMLSKEEKEVMLKEIHHRVKNNLQIVKSLVRFQMDQVEDPKVRELFNECITRVGAMALVHEQTYLTKDLANIDVRTYLDRLVRDLTHAYVIDTKLTLDVNIGTETLGVDTLVPLGLLINEVISNSLKYAFKDRSSGVILVHITGNEVEGLSMRIGDDGVGLPAREKWDRPNSLGMELIHTLAEQLNTSIHLLPGTGTVFELHSVDERHRRVA